MGNSLGGIIIRRKKKAKVIKINGETIKFNTPISVSDVIKDYPNHVLLDSDSVKHFGVRSTPLDLHLKLNPSKFYFLVELPQFPIDSQSRAPRRVRSSAGVQIGAKERLDLLMLSRRSISDITVVRPAAAASGGGGGPWPSRGGSVRVKMRLPKAQVAKLMEESGDDVEVARRIVDLYMANAGEVNGGAYVGEIMKVDKKQVSFAIEEEG